MRSTKTLIIVLMSQLLVVRSEAQTAAQVYALGVNLGFASVQISIGKQETTSLGTIKGAYSAMLSSISNALDVLKQINTTLRGKQQMNIVKLQTVYNDHVGYSPSSVQGSKLIFSHLQSDLLLITSGYRQQLEKMTGQPNLIHAYQLATFIGTAESNALVGESARTIVLSNLINAKFEAQSLKLDISGLEESMSLIAIGTTPWPQIYQKILGVRTSYQAALPN